MPPNRRATAVTIVMLGFSVGSAAVGQVTNFLAPGYGWQAVFWVSGAATLLLSFFLQFSLPGSVRWMITKGKPQDRILTGLRRIDPRVAKENYTRFLLPDERAQTSAAPWAKSAALFRGALAFVTPAIWFTYF
jgi:AAHS family 4-hydroxybenzoate transporter-like MFS transporter